MRLVFFFAIVATLAAGPVPAQSFKKAAAMSAQEFDRLITPKHDPFAAFDTLVGPTIRDFIPGIGVSVAYSLTGFPPGKDGKQIGALLSVRLERQEGGWLNIQHGYLMGGSELRLLSNKQQVGSCRAGCSVSESIGFDVPFEMMTSTIDDLPVKVSGDTAFVLNIPANYLKAMTARLVDAGAIRP